MKKIKKGVKTALRVTVVVFLSLLVLVAIALFILSRSIDYSSDEELFDAAKNTSVTHFFANESLSGDYKAVETEKTAFGAAKKVWYPISEMSDYLTKGFVAVEDREFYNHGGVNLRRTLGAFLNYLLKSGKRYGASTITQQVVKNISGNDEISAKRKLKEIFRAFRIEKNHTKEEIIELYMNIAPMSENIAGVGFAADRYFGKEPSD